MATREDIVNAEYKYRAARAEIKELKLKRLRGEVVDVGVIQDLSVVMADFCRKILAYCKDDTIVSYIKELEDKWGNITGNVV